MNNIYRPEGMLLGSATNREYTCGGRSALEKAISNGIILESTALLCDSEMNIHVDLNGITGIIPRSEACYSPAGEETKDIAIITRVGKPICFKVIALEDKNGRTYAYLSRREAQIECFNNYIYDMIPGDIISSRVTHLESFGAFVDIGCGIISLLSVDCISVSRFSHPRCRLYNGMMIYTVLKSIDREKNRIFVSMRELLGTWEENASLFRTGQTVAGIIRSVESYGVFVELTPNLAGLTEIKDGICLSPEHNGKIASVYIKSIIPERMKIKLVLIDTYNEDPQVQKLHYFIDYNTTKHINSWQYSPSCSNKLIRTDFEQY